MLKPILTCSGLAISSLLWFSASTHASQVATPTPLPRIVGEFEAPVKRLAFTNKGKQLLGATAKGEVQLLELKSSKRLKGYTVGTLSHADEFQVSRDGKYVAVGDGIVVDFLQAETGSSEARRIFPGASGAGSSHAMEWGPKKGESIYLVTPRDDVAQMPRANKGGYEVLEPKVSRASSLSLDKRGKRLAIGCYDGSIVMAKTYTMTVERTLKGSQPSIACVEFNPKGTELATGSRDKSILLWSPTKKESRMQLLGHAGGVSALAYHSKGKVLASGDDQGFVKLWEVKSGTCLGTIAPLENAKINSLAFAPDGKTLAAAGLGKGITLWDVSEWLK